MNRIALILLVSTALLAGAVSASGVDDWVRPPLPPLAPVAPLFGDDAPWPETVEAPWYHTANAEPVDVRRGWVDFGEQDAAVVLTAVTQLQSDRRGDATLTLECDGPARLIVDGVVVLTLDGEEDEATHDLFLYPGKVQLLIELRAEPGRRARFKLKLESDLDIAVTTDARRLLTDFGDTCLVPRIGDIALSPDGARLLVLHRERDEDGSTTTRLDLHDLARGRRSTVSENRVSSPRWLSDVRFAWRERGAVVMADVGKGHRHRVLDDVEGLRQYDLGAPTYYLADPGGDDPADPHRLTELRERLVDWSDTAVLWVRHGLTGLARSVPLTAAGDFHVTSFAVRRTSDGDRLAVVRKVPCDTRPFFFHEVWLLDGDGSDRELLATVRTGFEIWPMNLAWSPDGTQLAWTSSANDVGDGQPERNWARTDVWVCDVDTGDLRNLTADQDAAPHDRAGDALTWIDDATVAVPADLGRNGGLLLVDVDTATTRLLEAGGTVAHASVAPAARKAAWVHSSLTETDRVVTADLDYGDLAVAVEAPAPALLTPDVESFTFENSSGDRIDGWLYRPVVAPEGPVPLIVYYYGGAISSMGGFNTTHQWLAANGYAVYVLNPRGAHTYGQDFADHHVNDWGGRAAADVVEGVYKVLAAHPDLDPERVGCYGGSYGGFLTMSLLTQTDLFAAAVSMYGISNLASYWGEGIWGYTYGDMAMADSYPWNRPDLYADKSPLYHADRVTTPLLLLHGADDANVPPGESEQFFTALRVLGRDVELVRFAGEGHGISGTWRNRVAHRTMMLEWYDRWLRDRPGAWNDRWSEDD